MKITLIALLLFAPMISFAQNDDESILDFGLYFLPEMNNLTTSNTIGKESVEPRLGFSVGVNVAFNLTDKIALRTGVGYGIKQYSHLHEELIFNTDIDPQLGIVSYSHIESDISFNELQLPLIFQFNLTEKIFIAGGIELNAVIVDNSSRVVFYGNGDLDQANTTRVSKINYSPLFSLGFDVQKFNLTLEPMFKYYLESYLINETHLYNLGLKVSYRIAL